jgi:phage-related minor tail protein
VPHLVGIELQTSVGVVHLNRDGHVGFHYQAFLTLASDVTSCAQLIAAGIAFLITIAAHVDRNAGPQVGVASLSADLYGTSDRIRFTTGVVFVVAPSSKNESGMASFACA